MSTKEENTEGQDPNQRRRITIKARSSFVLEEHPPALKKEITKTYGNPSTPESDPFDSQRKLVPSTIMLAL